MNQRTLSSNISSDEVAKIEHLLDHHEIYGCIFLLHDNEEAALQYTMQEIQSSRKHRLVLDSAIFRAGESFHIGALARWARSCANDDHWQDKLLEALLIIKNYHIIKLLGKRKADLDLKFMPHIISTSYRVQLVRKVLFMMIEDLTIPEWNLLQNNLMSEAKKHGIDIPQLYCGVAECVMLFLMSRNLLKLKQGDQRMDFQLLKRSLERTDLHYWSQNIEDLEKVMNKETSPRVVEGPPRFNLDPRNPGTILIFNIENYVEKAAGVQQLTKRTGSLLDCRKLTETFQLLGFTVLPPLHDPSVKDIPSKIKKSLEKFCREAKAAKMERCFAVAILAHGEKDGVYDVHGDLVTWDSIRTELRSSNTQNLPRLLLVQACKGGSRVTNESNKLEVVEDGPSSHDPNAGNLRDLFELSASVSGFAAYRRKESGSFFIHSFCKQILLYGREMPLNDIATLINHDFQNKTLVHKTKCVSMTSELNVTASKSLYLGVSMKRDKEAKDLVRRWDDMEKHGEGSQPSSSINNENNDEKNSHNRKCHEKLKVNQPKNPELFEKLKTLALQDLAEK